MRSRLMLSVLLGVLLIWALNGDSQEAGATVAVAILSPKDGLSTSEVSVQVRGTASVAKPASILLVIIDVNGVAQKARLKGDGSFEASVKLSRGLNIISAIAVATNNEIGSDKVVVTSVPEILFFDDFTDKARPEWKSQTVGPSGRWTAWQGWYTVLDVPEWLPMQTFLPVGTWWKNYMVDLDVRFENSNEPRNAVAIFVRVQDEHNMVGFFLQPSGKSGFKIQQRGVWGDLLESADTPGFNNAHIRVIVKDHTYTALLNEQTLVTFEDKRRTFAQGYTGLQMAVLGAGWNRWVYFDNFQVKSLDLSAAATPTQPPNTSQPTTDLADRVSKLEKQVNQVETGMAALQGEVDKLSSQLGDIDVTNLQTTVGALSARVDQLEKQPPGTPAELSRRVDKLDSLVGNIDVKSLASELGAVKATVANLSSDHTKFGRELDELKRAPLSLSQIQQSLDGLDRKVEESNRKLEAAENFARLGLLVGAAGVALALLVVLGVIR